MGVSQGYRLYVLRAVAGVLTAALGSGCASTDAVTGPTFDPKSYLATVDILEEAVTLSVVPGSDTVRLHISTLFGDGSNVNEPIQFAASDSTIIVDSSGFVTAQFPTTTAAQVRASVTHNGLTRRDSVQIRVLPQLPTVKMTQLDLSVPSGMSPVIPALTAPTSTKNSGVGSMQLIVRGLDDNNVPVPTTEILIAVRSSDTTIAKVNGTGLVVAKKPGVVHIIANTFANGILAIDSIEIRVGLSLYAEYKVPSQEYSYTGIWKLGADTARIGVGGIIVWRSLSNPIPVDLVFDDPVNVEAAVPRSGYPLTGPGDIIGFRQVPLLPDQSNVLEYIYSPLVARKFSVPGVYRFHGVFQDPTIRNQIHGVIIVCPIDTDSCEP